MADFEDFNDAYDNLEDFDAGTEGYLGNTEHENGGLIDHIDDGLTVSEDDLNLLEDRASEVNRNDDDESQISFGRKMCPTRGGCQGATDCDYSYGSYPG